MGLQGLLETGMRGKGGIFPEVVSESCLGCWHSQRTAFAWSPQGCLHSLPPVSAPS